MPCRTGATTMPSCAAAAPSLIAVRIGLPFDSSPVLQAIVPGKTAHQFAVHPLLQDAADIFAGNAGHRSEIALRDLLPQDDTPAADVATERFSEVEQRPGHASLDGQEAGCCERVVRVAQTACQQDHHMPVDFGVGATERLEGGTAYKSQLGVAQRRDGSG